MRAQLFPQDAQKLVGEIEQLAHAVARTPGVPSNQGMSLEAETEATDAQWMQYNHFIAMLQVCTCKATFLSAFGIRQWFGHLASVVGCHAGGGRWGFLCVLALS